MTSPKPELAISPNHQRWLDEHNTSMVLDNEALQNRAAELNASIDPAPHIFISDFGPMPQDEAHLIVDWRTPNLRWDDEGHQIRLSRALDISLLTIAQEAQRRLTNVWSGVGFAVGTVIAGIGELMKNDAVHYSGVGLLAASGIALTANNTRRPPQPPEDIPEHPPLRLEPDPDSTPM